MIDVRTKLANNTSFKDFIFKGKRHKSTLIFVAIAIVTQFSIFKYFYPFASYIHDDSFSYIKTAFKNLGVDTYLVGYSRFLRLISVFTTSDTILVTFQYILIQCSALYLIFTIFYFYQISKISQYVLIAFMVLNPLFLHLANLVSSDGFFTALSLIWFSLLLWIVHSASNRIIVWHAIVLFICFTVRYNALIYPIIAIMVFSLSKITIHQKLFGIGLVLMLCGSFIYYTEYQYKKLTGYWQFSPFSGWQLTNNAMYVYRYVDKSERKNVPLKFQEFDNMVREYFDSTRDIKRFPLERVQASTYYMWSPGLPMWKYAGKTATRNKISDNFIKWARMGPFFKSYGLYIISQYPQLFIRYFIWPNANKYYAPPVEFLQFYNSGKDSVTISAKNWFEYKSVHVKTRLKNNKIQILDFYPILSGITNVLMLFSLILYGILKRVRDNSSFNKAILIGSTVWILNAGFTIGASSAALRFQSFPILITFTIMILLLDWEYKTILNPKIKSPPAQIDNYDNNYAQKYIV